MGAPEGHPQDTPCDRPATGPSIPLQTKLETSLITLHSDTTPTCQLAEFVTTALTIGIANISLLSVIGKAALRHLALASAHKGVGCQPF
jgi:hypothetical protein